MTRSEIDKRLGQITFNSPIQKELEAIGLMKTLVRKEGESVSLLGRKVQSLRLHHLSAEDHVDGLSQASVLNTDWSFLTISGIGGEQGPMPGCRRSSHPQVLSSANLLWTTGSAMTCILGMIPIARPCSGDGGLDHGRLAVARCSRWSSCQRCTLPGSGLGRRTARQGRRKSRRLPPKSRDADRSCFASTGLRPAPASGPGWPPSTGSRMWAPKRRPSSC